MAHSKIDTSKVSRKGVYYDLSLSPYEVNSYGISYKFSSQKKKEIFLRKVEERFERIDTNYARHMQLCDIIIKRNDYVNMKVMKLIYSQIEV